MSLIFRQFSKPQDYVHIFDLMREFTLNRTLNCTDEIWFLEHQPVFTQGQAGKAEHVIAPGDIPVIQSDRGGQVTYHGPGQLMIYTLLSLKRYALGVRDCVTLLEQGIIRYLKDFDIQAHLIPNAPGVYVDSAKICSIGLRIRKGFSYHGISLNIDMDLSPFQRINPCGFKDLKMTQLKAFQPNITLSQVKTELAKLFQNDLGYDAPIEFIEGFAKRPYE